MIRDRILELVSQHPEGLDDDEIASLLGLRQRQQANLRCRLLVAEGLIERRRLGGKIRNFPKTMQAGYTPPLPPPPAPPRQAAGAEDLPWFWEGHVQSWVASHLAGLGWIIEQVADTAGKKPGKDIVARSKDGASVLWVSVKGYPQGTSRTNPPTQARHWFSHAMFDMILWRDEDLGVKLACAFPDFPTYRKLASRSTWFVEAVPFTLYWVSADEVETAE